MEEQRIECPQCHNRVTGSDATSVEDHGRCLECQHAWQCGELNDDDDDEDLS